MYLPSLSTIERYVARVRHRQRVTACDAVIDRHKPHGATLHARSLNVDRSRLYLHLL